MKIQYEIVYSDTSKRTVRLTYQEWRTVFLTGKFEGAAVLSIEPLGQPTHRVTFSAGGADGGKAVS
ncbi:MAG: hypothetical protein E6Q97_13050 [Desulfurellales bacterium]|jgi:hypothetical protein|nr:MAG: hypothetical protein E6Q97_13050 [Desulfurellales bacterium]